MSEETRRPDEQVLPVVEETLTIGRRAVTTGVVRVSTGTEAVDAVLDAVVATSEVEVTRVSGGTRSRNDAGDSGTRGT